MSMTVVPSLCRAFGIKIDVMSLIMLSSVQYLFVSAEDESKLKTAAEKVHESVKRWTKVFMLSLSWH